MAQNDAELALIGLAMTDQESAEKIAALPDDLFGAPETVRIHQIIKTLVRERKVPDLATVYMNIGPEESSAIRETVTRAAGAAIVPALYAQYEGICLELRMRRRLRNVCSQVASRAEDPAEDVEVLADKIIKVVNDQSGASQSVSMGEAVQEFIDKMTEKDNAIYTGIAGLDRLTGGIRDGMLTILGARPGVGKTSLALSIAKHVAEKSGPVLFVSMEMTPNELMDRLVSMETCVAMQNIVTKRMAPEEWRRTITAASGMAGLPFRFLRLRTPMQIRREAGAMKRAEGLRLIVVDYIQLMRGDGKTSSRYEEVSSISMELKAMAMDLEVPILALTQFNRESEMGGGKRKPSMSEARDSGSIEQDANMFLVLWEPPEPKPATDNYQYWAACHERGTQYMLLSIDKNRQGPTGAVPMEFDPAHMRFVSLRRESE